MKRIFLFCLVTCILFAASCHKDKKENCYRDYTAADIAQLSYTHFDTILFKSNLGFVDTVFIGNIYETDITDNGGCPDQRTKKDAHFSGVDSVFQKYGGNDVFIRKPLKSDLLAKTEFFFSGYITNWDSPVTMVVNSKTVNNVYPVSASTGQYFTKLYWSYTYGIIRIDHANGSIWERIDF